MWKKWASARLSSTFPPVTWTVPLACCTRSTGSLPVSLAATSKFDDLTAFALKHSCYLIYVSFLIVCLIFIYFSIIKNLIYVFSYFLNTDILINWSFEIYYYLQVCMLVSSLLLIYIIYDTVIYCWYFFLIFFSSIVMILAVKQLPYSNSDRPN